VNDRDREAARFVESHVAELQPLATASNLAHWEAATTGTEEAVARSAQARARVKLLYSRPADAARVKELLASGDVADPLLRRQLVLLDHAYTANQLPESTIEDFSRREAELEQTFYNFRAELDGERLSNNEVLEVLRTERAGERRRAAWEAGKRIGRELAEPLRELVRRRNAAARDLGFSDYYAMELALQEIDEAQLFSLLEEFRAASEVAFARLRAEIDGELAERYGVAVEELRPWHWEDPFAQVAPRVGGVSLDPIFRGRDLVALAREYFDRIGLPVDDVLARSDLFEREGKDQHAFCTDVDREGDVRILCNLRDDEQWMGTLLHELGHAVYDRFVPRSLPYLVRAPAHTLSTEAIAMIMGRLTRQPAWLRGVDAGALDDGTARGLERSLRTSMLIVARWILVMCHFERELYRDPDRADLGALWWDLVEDLQKIRRPDERDEPDWATKIHLSVAPVYYHNYLLGEWMASQLAHSVGEALNEGRPEAGAFLRERIFAHGARLHWDDLLVEATGERLTPRHFLGQFVEPPSPAAG
jgi:peptidyl-dipeptidase A